MKNVADRLGVSRQTVYRTFENRDELVAALFFDQFYQRVFGKVKDRMAGIGFEQALVEGTRLTIKLMRGNAIMMELMYRGGAQWYQNNMFDSDSCLHRGMMGVGEGLWGGHLAKAREEGLLNPALTDYEIYDWLGTIHYMMIFRRKATDEDNVALIEKLAIPALMSQPRDK